MPRAAITAPGSSSARANRPLLRSSAVPTAVTTNSAQRRLLCRNASGCSSSSKVSSESVRNAAAKSVSLVIDTDMTEKTGCSANSAVSASIVPRPAPRRCTNAQA